MKNFKSRECSLVLQLMDKDWDYSKALEKVLNENPKVNKVKLEKELGKYI
jgi:hypothetical protein